MHYSQRCKERALRHEGRARLFGFVSEHPGTRRFEIQRDLGWYGGFIDYHLRVLARAELIVIERGDGEVRYRVARRIVLPLDRPPSAASLFESATERRPAPVAA